MPHRIRELEIQRLTEKILLQSEELIDAREGRYSKKYLKELKLQVPLFYSNIDKLVTLKAV